MKRLFIFFSLLLLFSTGCGHVDVSPKQPEGPDVWQFDFWGDVTWTLYARMVDNTISEKELSGDITASTHGPGRFNVDYMRAKVEDGILSDEINPIVA